MNILQKLTAIQTKLKVPKTRKNQFGNYKFRSAEDILEHIKPFLKQYDASIIISNKTKEKCGMPYIRAKAKFFDNKNKDQKPITARDDAFIDLNQKGMQMPQKSGTASSYAKKYALGNLLCLDDTNDSDSINKSPKLETYQFNEFINKYKTKDKLDKLLNTDKYILNQSQIDQIKEKLKNLKTKKVINK
jgi:hypothetical protein